MDNISKSYISKDENRFFYPAGAGIINVFFEWDDPALFDHTRPNFMQDTTQVKKYQHHRTEPLCNLINKWACEISGDEMNGGVDVIGRYRYELIGLVKPCEPNQQLYIYGWIFVGITYTNRKEQYLVYKKALKGNETFDTHPMFASPLRVIVASGYDDQQLKVPDMVEA